MRAAPRELLRLITLRGARAGLAVDLAPRVPDSEVLRRMEGNLGLLGQPELVQRVVAPVRLLDDSDLAATSLRRLRTELEKIPRLSNLTVDIGEPVPLGPKELPRSAAFIEDLLLVYDSWLAQRITRGPKSSLAAHVRLLRAAAVVIEWAPHPEVPLERPLSAWLDSTVITTPRSWAAYAQAQLSVPARREATPNSPSRSRKLTAVELRSTMNTVTTGLEAMRKVGNVVVEAMSMWERSQAVMVDDAVEDQDASEVVPRGQPRVDSGPQFFSGSSLPGVGATPPFRDDQIRQALALKVDAIKGVPDEARARLRRTIERPGTMNEFFGALVMIAADEDSELCAEIQAIETAILRDLPPAPSPTKPDQPPLISAVGLGDLVIARERLVGYEANEISHIQNVLPGEVKKVELERRHRFEETIEDETTTVEESQTDTDTTDRASKQQQSREGMENSLAVDAGVNVSSKYGATKIDASLDVQFQKSNSESSSETIEAVHEIVTRTVERSREELRKLRRTLTVDETRSLDQHDIDNTAEGVGGSPSAISGVYRWVEKVQEIELRRYGTRLRPPEVRDGALVNVDHGSVTW